MSNNISNVDCCYGCGACIAACPKNAISVSYNGLGQMMPKVDKSLCVSCGLCRRACPSLLERPIMTEQPKAFIAADLMEDSLAVSTSGGIAAVLSRHWIERGGIVCGAAGLEPEGDEAQFHVRHILVEKIEDLHKIQGSKYVQSSILEVLPELKERISRGDKVLFFGTSCQVDGLKQYLGKPCENLVTCDLICHGVLGSEIFRQYLIYLEKKGYGPIQRVSFRRKDTDTIYKLSFNMGDSEQETVIDKNDSSYYRMFLSCIGYRRACYKCPYASLDKPGDITLGDYFEAAEDYSELFNQGIFSLQKGVSAVLVRTYAGKRLFDACADQMVSREVSAEKVRKSHKQLYTPSRPKKGAKLILLLYLSFGWRGVEAFYSSFDTAKKYIRKMLNR